MRILHSLFILFLTLMLSACGPKPWDEPALHDAAMRGDLAEVKALIKDGADVNKLNQQGATPLHWAAFKGHLDVAKYLVGQGAKINAITEKGSTPLRLAKTHKQEAIVQYPKSRGAQ
ncbi:ankyrin repeat domain-containing protein [Catenovulum sp. SM1970]|uniref:ankyrin repeat domain-containing protein n=1 Tax=Marinifaba aquimaris TaxID=2741323 RepID=UPI0015737A84|nr:ankyrin repeat domain-containing protein [Marinifaba aquimaris]NTS77829.1 ankyrin repeat domain-containing protein [Marinifaba aquimaris]